MHERRSVAAVIAFAVGVLLTARGCGEEADSTAVVESTGDASIESSAGMAGYDAKWDASGNDDAKEDAEVQCPSVPVPEGTPEGWEEYPLFDCRFRLYVPPSHDQMPAGLQWEQCTDLGPDIYGCRQLVIDWETDASPYIGGVANAYVRDDGNVVLQLRRVFRRAGKTAFMGLVTEADGPVLQALWQPYYAGQLGNHDIAQHSIAPGKSSWIAAEIQDGTVSRGMSLAGDDESLRPPIIWEGPAEAPDLATAVVGTHYYAATGYQVRVFGWDGTDHGIVMPSAYNLDALIWTGPTLLWGSYSTEIKRLWTWTEQQGSQPLLSFGSDTTRGAANLGTDGKDLIWVQGEDRPMDETDYPSRSIMTAKFTTSAADLEPRRLRSWRPPYIGTDRAPAAVGCGFAALRDVPDDTVIDLLIVRLSDGVAWRLRSPEDRRWMWGPPIAVTCDEIFTMWGVVGGITHIRRIRLDSLGEGLPPD